MKSLAIKKFTANLVLERSITPTPEQLGEHESSMELFDNEDGSFFIEWDVPSLDIVETIGIWLDPDQSASKKVVSDYDGVFSLPKEAVELLEENGFDCSQVKD